MKDADTLITIFGGSGFLGQEVMRALAERRYRLRIAVRHPYLTGHLQPPGLSLLKNELRAIGWGQAERAGRQSHAARRS
jgi:uncharacterized protein YbjT (DUF2867 family)